MHTQGGDRVSWAQWLSWRSVLGHEGTQSNCSVLGERRLRVESQKGQHLHSGFRGWVGIGGKGREGCKDVLCGGKSNAEASPELECFWEGTCSNLRSPITQKLPKDRLYHVRLLDTFIVRESVQDPPWQRMPHSIPEVLVLIDFLSFQKADILTEVYSDRQWQLESFPWELNHFWKIPGSFFEETISFWHFELASKDLSVWVGIWDTLKPFHLLSSFNLLFNW